MYVVILIHISSNYDNIILTVLL